MNGDIDRPNIIWIMADDMGWGDLGAYGATKIPTPNTDRLAAEGCCFTDAHSSSAVCTPSRYSVLTGRYCWRTRLKSGVLWGHSPPLIDPDRLTVGQMLKDAGYATAAIGKWHLGLGWSRSEEDKGPNDDGADVDYTKPIADGPTTRGFDYYFGISASLDMPPYCFIENDDTVGVPNIEKHPYAAQQRKGRMTQGWIDENVDVTFTHKATQFIKSHHGESPDQPFFLYMPMAAPHRPCVGPDFIRGISDAGPRGDMVALFDWAVGEVMSVLDQLGIADETLIIVTSDNGARPADVDGDTHEHKSCGDWRGYKADIWDGGHREPFIVRWPGTVQPGTRNDSLVCLGDFMATAADIVGCDLPNDAAEDSLSFLPALMGNDDEMQREAIVHHSVGGMFSVRKGDWKLCERLGSGGFSEPRNPEPGPGDPPGQLYNLATDPAEADNVWHDHPEIVERLQALLQTYQDEGRSIPARG